MTREEREKEILKKIKRNYYYANKDKPYWINNNSEKNKLNSKRYKLNNPEKIAETTRRTTIYQRMEKYLVKLGYTFVKDERRVYYRTILNARGEVLIQFTSIYTMEDFDVFISKIYEGVEEQKRFEEYGKLLGFESV